MGVRQRIPTSMTGQSYGWNTCVDFFFLKAVNEYFVFKLKKQKFVIYVSANTFTNYIKYTESKREY